MPNTNSNNIGNTINQQTSNMSGLGQMPTSPWSTIGAAADAVGSLLPVKSEYSGDKSSITAGMDAAYDGISDTLMNVPPWGTVVGGIMKGASLLGKGLNAAGLGTDGMTTQDAILGSSFFNWNVGLINGIGAKKTDKMERDNWTWAQSGNSYQGSLGDFNSAMTKQGKKYGLLSGSERNKANEAIWSAGRDQNRLKTIMNDNAMTNEVMANQQDMINRNYTSLMQGGYQQGAVRAAKHGGVMFTQDQIRRAKGISFSVNFNNVEPVVQFKEDVEMFQKGGQMTVIPEGALHAHKHNLEKEREDLKGEITHKGIPVIDNDGNQQAEIERDEVILSLDLTQAVEELRKQFNESESPSEKDELALQAGKLIVEEFQTNLDDRTGLYKQIKA